MTFYTIQDLAALPESFWDGFSDGGEAVITNDGRPAAIVVGVAGGDAETMQRAIRQAKASAAFHSMRARAANQGFMDGAEIEAEIIATRQSKPQF